MKEFNGRKNQRGVTLIEMILVIGLIAVATVVAFFEKRLEMEQTRARATGVLLFEYNNAVRSWLSQNLGSNGVMPQGTAWLKHTSCPGGGSAFAYLPCDFPDATLANPIRFGNLTLESTVVSVGVGPTTKTTVTTTTSSFQVQDGNDYLMRSDLAGLAAIVAAAGGVNNVTPMLASTDGSFSSDPATARITMTAGNSGEDDQWLRTDGSNTMNNNIVFKSTSPASMRELTNASRIQNLAGEALFIGNLNGAASAFSTIVDADMTVMGRLIIDNTRNEVTGIDLARGDIDVQDGSVVVSEDVVVSSIKANPAVNARLRLSGDSIQLTDETLTTTQPVPLTGHINVDSLRVRTSTGKSVPLTNLLPRWVHFSSWYARDGEYVTKPTCSTGGTPRVIVTPQSIPTNIYAPPSGYSNTYRGASFAHAIDAGGSWQVRIYPYYHYTNAGSAIAATYCQY